ncbi:hypothetical protein [Mesorhizobium xinjiangense]|uniref:hypothetical protein n=1 Tax=Mesorhizobium xinjiangense TaxID=2678685 RepID=UPI001F1E91BE|nr:hypothetical protein [Mesorhizobium xinjiangense]
MAKSSAVVPQATRSAGAAAADGPVAPAAAAPAGRFQQVLLLVGQLNYTWTNTESLLIYLMAGLGRLDKETAIIIFLTLNTTRARIDLVERLAKLPRTPAQCRQDVLDAMKRMNQQAKLRNKYNHCIYSFDEKGEPAHTQLMRIFDSKNAVKYGKIEAIDDRELARIGACINEIGQVNKQIWHIVRTNRFPQ